MAFGIMPGKLMMTGWGMTANIFLSSIFLSSEPYLWNDFALPIEFSENIRALDQEAFGAIAYDVMEQAFQVHNKLGRFFDEDAYRQELAYVLRWRAVTEAAIMVKYADFCKRYYIDLLLDQGAIFELKTVNHLTDEYRAQLLNYLLLTGGRHGKRQIDQLPAGKCRARVCEHNAHLCRQDNFRGG